MTCVSCEYQCRYGYFHTPTERLLWKHKHAILLPYNFTRPHSHNTFTNDHPLSFNEGNRNNYVSESFCKKRNPLDNRTTDVEVTEKIKYVDISHLNRDISQPIDSHHTWNAITQKHSFRPNQLQNNLFNTNITLSNR